MFYAERVPTAAHHTRWIVLATPVVGGAALIGLLGHQLSAPSSSSTAASSSTTASVTGAVPPISAAPPVPPTHESPEGDPHGALGEADGVVPGGVTVFSDRYPAVAKLDPALLTALRRAATDAAHDRVVFYVDSGWRSPKYQQRLLDQAIAKYGSEKEAARWVATPNTSAHVTGNAVDIGHSDATAWLSKHGPAYGLCQIYRDESWHYELRPEAVDHGCPPMYADPTHDPRMQP